MRMSERQSLATFVHDACYEQISRRAVEQLKIRILDTLGIAIGTPTTQGVIGCRDPVTLSKDSRRPLSTGDDNPRPDAASLSTMVLGPHLDFGDLYLAHGRICHPSDNIGAVLVAADHAGANGRNFITAVAVAYQIQTRLSDVAPSGANDIDPMVVRAYATSVAVAKVQGFDAVRIANVLAHLGSTNDVRASQQGTAVTAVRPEGGGATQQNHADGTSAEASTMLASIEWAKEGLESVLNTIMRVHYADVWGQPSIAAALTIATPPVFRAGDGVRAVRMKTFQAAYDAIGGGDGIDRQHVSTKNEAAQSLPYMIAVALLDRQVQPKQYAVKRIVRSDVQALLRKVSVTPLASFTACFPAAMPAQIDVEMADATRYCVSVSSFQGFTLLPLDWGAACEKFYVLVAPFVDNATAVRITRCVHELDSRDVHELASLLAKVSQHHWR